MKSKVAGINLSLWCEDGDAKCPHLANCKEPMRCKYFGKLVERDIRVTKDGHPMRLDVCMMADLASDVYEVEDGDDEYSDEFVEEEEVPVDED